MQVKPEFLVSYDYGMGGVWGIAIAPSKEQLIRALPELTVVDEQPAWLNTEHLARIRKNDLFDVDDPSTYPQWLKVVVQNRDSS